MPRETKRERAGSFDEATAQYKQFNPEKNELDRALKAVADDLEQSQIDGKLPNINLLEAVLLNFKNELEANRQKRRLFQLLNTQLNNYISTLLVTTSRDLFKSIPKDELYNVNNALCPNKMQFINYNSALNSFIIQSILSPITTPDNREFDTAAATIKKEFWIWIMQNCMKHNDYYSASGIYNALEAAYIGRLTSLNEGLSNEARSILEKARTLFETTSKDAREKLIKLSESQDGSVMLLGQYTFDLVSTDEKIRKGKQSTKRSLLLEDQFLLQKLLEQHSNILSNDAITLLTQLLDGTKIKKDCTPNEDLIIGNALDQLLEQDKTASEIIAAKVIKKHPDFAGLESHPVAQEIVNTIETKQNQISFSNIRHEADLFQMPNMDKDVPVNFGQEMYEKSIILFPSQKYVHILMCNKGEPNSKGKPRGFYLYKEENSGDIKCLIVHSDTIEPDHLNLTALAGNKQEALDALQQIEWPNEDDQITLLDQKIVQLVTTRQIDPSEFKSNILQFSNKKPILRPHFLRLAFLFNASSKQKKVNSDILKSLQVTFKQEIGGALPETIKIAAHNLTSAANVNAILQLIDGPAPRIKEIEEETPDELLKRIQSISITGEQRQLIRDTYAAELEEHPDKRDAFEEALTSEQFTCEGVNRILSTLAPDDKPYLAPQLSTNLYQDYDATQLQNLLEGLQPDNKKRTLLRKAFQYELVHTLPKTAIEFEASLSSTTLITIDQVNEVLEPLHISLPKTIADDALDVYLQALPIRALIIQKTLPELALKNAEDKKNFFDKLNNLTTFDRKSVSSLLNTIKVELPEKENLEASIEALPGIARQDRRLIQFAARSEINDENKEAFEAALNSPGASFTHQSIDQILATLGGEPPLVLKVSTSDERKTIEDDLKTMPALSRAERHIIFDILCQKLSDLSPKEKTTFNLDLNSNKASFSVDYLNNNILKLFNLKIDTTESLSREELITKLQAFKTKGLTEAQKQLLRDKFKSEITDQNSEQFEAALKQTDFTPDSINTLIKSLSPKDALPFYGISYALMDEDAENLSGAIQAIPLPGIPRNIRELIRENVAPLLDQYTTVFQAALDSPDASVDRKDINTILAHLDIYPPLKLPKEKNLEDAINGLPAIIAKNLKAEESEEVLQLKQQQRKKASSFSEGKESIKPKTRERANSDVHEYNGKLQKKLGAKTKSKDKFDELVGKPAKTQKPSKTKGEKAKQIPEPPHRKNESQLSSKTAGFDRVGFEEALHKLSLKFNVHETASDHERFNNYTIKTNHNKDIIFQEERCLFRVDTSDFSDEELFNHFIQIGELAIAGNLRSMDVEKVHNPNSRKFAVLALKTLGLEVTGYDPKMEATPADESIVDKFRKDHPKLQHELKELQQLGKQYQRATPA